MVVFILLAFKASDAFNKGVVLRDECLKIGLVLHSFSFVIFHFLSSIVDVVAGVFQPLLSCSPSLLFPSQSFLQFVHEIFIRSKSCNKRLVFCLQFFNGFKHLLTFPLILGNGVILIVDPLGKGEDLVDLVEAVLFFLLISLAAGICMRSFFCQIEAGLKGATDIPIISLFQAGLHFIECTPEKLVLVIDSTQVVMQDCDFQAFCLILFLQTLCIFVKEVNPLLKVFVRHHITKLLCNNQGMNNSRYSCCILYL